MFQNIYSAYFNSCFQQSYLSETEFYFTVSNAGFEATGSLYDHCRLFCKTYFKKRGNFLTNYATYLKIPHFHAMNIGYLLAHLCKRDKEREHMPEERSGVNFWKVMLMKHTSQTGH